MHQWTIQYRTNVYECLSPGLRIGSTVNSMQLCKVSLRFASTLSCMSSNCNLKWICHFAFIWNPLQMVSYQLLTTSAVHWNVKLAFDDDGTSGVMEWLSTFVRSDLDDGKVLPVHCWQSTIHSDCDMLVYSFESQSWVRVKVVKWCRKNQTSIVWCISITNNVKSFKKWNS